MTQDGLDARHDESGAVYLTLSRPEKRNAVDDVLVRALSERLTALAAEAEAGDANIRCVILQGAGESFCAGGDLAWMRRLAEADLAANRADAEALGNLLATLAAMPVPTVALVQGAAIGAGLGLVAACDIAVAADGTRFAMPEARLGLVPGVIAPVVADAIGLRAARYYSLTGARFDAETALQLGLVQRVTPAEDLAAAGEALRDSLQVGAPGAHAETKAQFAWLRDADSGRAAAIRDGAGRLAARRASAEGREGMSAFLEKRNPVWRR